MRRFRLVVFAALLASLAAVGVARSDTVAERLTLQKLFTAPAIAESWFTSEFLGAIPIDQVRAMTAGLTKQLGSFRSVEDNAESFTVHFANGSTQAVIALDGDEISELRFYDTQSDGAEARLAAMFNSVQIKPDWFSDAFLAHIPADQVQTVIGNTKAQLGRYKSATPNPDGSYTLNFDTGTDRAQITLDGAGKVVNLQLDPPSSGP